jgi:hypothetical protein
MEHFFNQRCLEMLCSITGALIYRKIQSLHQYICTLTVLYQAQTTSKPKPKNTAMKKITFQKMQDQVDRLLKRKLLKIYEFNIFVEYFGKKNKYGKRTVIASYTDILRDWENPFPLLNQRNTDWNIFRNSSHPLEKIKMSYLLHDLLHHNNFSLKDIEDIERILVQIVPTVQYSCRLHWFIKGDAE